MELSLGSLPAPSNVTSRLFGSPELLLAPSFPASMIEFTISSAEERRSLIDGGPPNEFRLFASS